MFPGLPLPEPLTTNDFDQVVELLRSGDWVLSFAGRLANVGLPLARYTRADHQFPLADLRSGRVVIQDPMHPPSLRWPGHRVPLGQVEKAGRDLPDQTRVLAWKYPIGGWRAAVQEAEGVRARLRDERDRTAILSSKVEGQTERIESLRARVAELEAGQGTDCSGPIASAWERSHVEAIAFHDRKRTEGP
jgi:hypothetical protein